MSEESQRLSADEIFQLVTSSAREELDRAPTGLAISGFAAGMEMGLSALGVAAILAAFGESKGVQFASAFAYPIGFIAVIIGRSQLFTENTLYPVVLVLDEQRHFWKTLRLWIVVFLGNVIGALVFALLAVRTAAVTPELRQSLLDAGVRSAHHPASHLFWSAVIGGWLVALMAWLVAASQWSIAQISVTYLLGFLLGAGHFTHCIVGSTELLSAIAGGALTPGEYLRWLGLATAGNILGGITIVSLLNWGQVTADK
jgi:formate/nitrite transporter FocA (FNT family)